MGVYHWCGVLFLGGKNTVKILLFDVHFLGMKRATREGQAELMIAKHRNGNTGNLRIAFDGARSKFTNFDKPIYDSSQPTKNRFFPYNFISQPPTLFLHSNC